MGENPGKGFRVVDTLTLNERIAHQDYRWVDRGGTLGGPVGYAMALPVRTDHVLATVSYSDLVPQIRRQSPTRLLVADHKRHAVHDRRTDSDSDLTEQQCHCATGNDEEEFCEESSSMPGHHDRSLLEDPLHLWFALALCERFLIPHGTIPIKPVRLETLRSTTARSSIGKLPSFALNGLPRFSRQSAAFRLHVAETRSSMILCKEYSSRQSGKCERTLERSLM